MGRELGKMYLLMCRDYVITFSCSIYTIIFFLKIRLTEVFLIYRRKILILT